jgi:phosphoglycolate phosphatase
MAVLTNKPVDPSRDICRALDLESCFFRNYSGKAFDTKKPDTAGLRTLIVEAYARTTRHSPITPQETIMIGDSLTRSVVEPNSAAALSASHPPLSPLPSPNAPSNIPPRSASSCEVSIGCCPFDREPGS